MLTKFSNALREKAPLFNVELTEHHIKRLETYYEMVIAANPLLHLVAPTSPEEFATRHILESLTLLEYLPENSRFADIGAGAGLPSVPCLIVHEDLKAVLIESKEKKADFLKSVFSECQLTERAEIVNRQFSEIKRPDLSYVTCRALDKFQQNLPRLIKWSSGCTLLFFGGPALGDELRRLGLKPKERLMPLSEQRYIFVVEKRR